MAIEAAADTEDLNKKKLEELIGKKQTITMNRIVIAEYRVRQHGGMIPSFLTQ